MGIAAEEPRRSRTCAPLLAAALALCCALAAWAQTGIKVHRFLPGPFTEEQAAAREKSIALVEKDTDGCVRRYLELVTASDGGKPEGDLAAALRRGRLMVNSDEAKKIFPEYSMGPGARLRYGGAVHEASASLALEVLARALRAPARRGEWVLFAGGGPASGKSAYLACRLKDPDFAPSVIFDSALSSAPFAVRNIDAALKGGRTVEIAYLDTPLETTIPWLVARARGGGHALTAQALGYTSRSALETALTLLERYKDEPRVKIRIIRPDGKSWKEEGQGKFAKAARERLRRYPSQAHYAAYAAQLLEAEIAKIPSGAERERLSSFFEPAQARAP